jgi:hypothetical protein
MALGSTPDEKLHMLNKYTAAEHAAKFDVALGVWEKCAQLISHREDVLQRLVDLQRERPANVRAFSEALLGELYGVSVTTV